MKTLNDYGKDVMDAQARMDAINASIEKTEAALASLGSDRQRALADLGAAREALQAATDRVKSGDYGVDDEQTKEAVEAILNDDTPFDGVKPTVRPDEVFRTHAGNGAGF